jgi:hypothetical protein
MSKQETSPGAAGEPSVDLPVAETSLGKALALIHRILPRLEEPSRATEVDTALRQAVACLEAARRSLSSAKGAGAQAVATGVSSEIAAVIAAAVAVVLDQPYRLVSVQQVATPVPYLNVWALEGRTQIFQSHKIR